MLLNLFSWILLAGSAAAVGSAVLAMTRSSFFLHFGDRVITAIWLGLLIIAATLLGLSTVLPLSPGAGFGLMAVLAVSSLSAEAVRRDLQRLLEHLKNGAGAGLGVLALIGAFSSTRLVEAYDTGLYHYPLTRWLSSYGTVRGLALIHFRFGFSSSWFALAAPFDFGPFQGRIAGLLGGFAIVLCLAHFGLALSRLLQQRGDRADWFLLGGYIFIFFVCLSWAFEVSLSPDVPVWILTLLGAWLMLVATSPKLGKDALPADGYSFIAVLILALGTVTLKPSAAPIVVVAGAFFWFNSPAPWSRRLFLALISGLVAVPVVMANVTSSGCPLYPSSVLCLNVPWGVGEAGARVISADIADWGRWREGSSSAATVWSWLIPWISQPDKLALVLLCGLCLLGFGALRGWRADKAVLYVLGLALFGTLFLLATAPNPRFGAGYFALYPALLLAAAGPRCEGLLRRGRANSQSRARSATLGYVFVGIAALLAVHGTIRELITRKGMAASAHFMMPEDSKLARRIILPPALAASPGDIVITKNRRLNRVGRLELATERSNGIEYRTPKDRDQCWAAALPCVPGPLEGDVGLRLPANGLSSGFTRSAKFDNLTRR
jgi:hypothetical protein